MTIRLVRAVADEAMKFEYGLQGSRLLPWPGMRFPFGGAYCVVAPNSESAAHVNSPDDEEELFIGISGKALAVVDEQTIAIGQGDLLFVPRGSNHFVRNVSGEPFVFYTIWWNRQGVDEFAAQADRAAES